MGQAMSLRIENRLVASGQRLTNRIITLRSQSVIPAFVFRRVVKPVTNSDNERKFDTWAGLGVVSNSEDHAIDYEPLGHAMVLMLDMLGGASHDTGMFILPEEMSSMALIEPYDIELEGDERLKNAPDWEPKKGDLFCLLLNEHKEYHECTGVMGLSMMANHGKRYALAQRFDLNYLDAFREEDIDDVAVPYE